MPGIKKGKVFSVGFSPNEICVLEFLKNKPASIIATGAGFFYENFSKSSQSSNKVRLAILMVIMMVIMQATKMASISKI